MQIYANIEINKHLLASERLQDSSVMNVFLDIVWQDIIV